MLPADFSSVLEAQSAEVLGREIARFSKRLGFDTYSALAVAEQPGADALIVPLHNAPADYVDAFNDVQRSLRDPVLKHCKNASVPIVWTRDTYARASDLWEEQAGFGYHTGIAMALHLPEGRHFVFGVDRDQKLPEDEGELQRLVADLQLFAVYAQDAAMRLLLPPALQPERPDLTPRELEVLYWTMEGKTAWEVGAILGISERTAVMHVNNAMHKLQATNKIQAVAKAMKLGLIH